MKGCIPSELIGHQLAHWAPDVLIAPAAEILQPELPTTIQCVEERGAEDIAHRHHKLWAGFRQRSVTGRAGLDPIFTLIDAPIFVKRATSRPLPSLSSLVHCFMISTTSGTPLTLFFLFDEKPRMSQAPEPCKQRGFSRKSISVLGSRGGLRKKAAPSPIGIMLKISDFPAENALTRTVSCTKPGMAKTAPATLSGPAARRIKSPLGA